MQRKIKETDLKHRKSKHWETNCFIEGYLIPQEINAISLYSAFVSVYSGLVIYKVKVISVHDQASFLFLISYILLQVKILLKIRNSSRMWSFFIFNNKDTRRLTLSSQLLSLSAWDSRKVFISLKHCPSHFCIEPKPWEASVGYWHHHSHHRSKLQMLFANQIWNQILQLSHEILLFSPWDKTYWSFKNWDAKSTSWVNQEI